MAKTITHQEILPAEDDCLPPISDKYRVFADAVLDGKSNTQAAIDAGFAVGSAAVTAYRIINRPEVQAYIAAKRAKITEKAEYSAAEWQRELRALAHSNIQDFTRLNSDGDLEVDFSNASRDQLRAVQGVKVKKRKIYDNRGNVVGEEHHSEFRLWDKLRAAELLGKHAGFLQEPEQRVVVDVADRLLRARARVLGLPSAEHGEAESQKSVDSQ